MHITTCRIRRHLQIDKLNATPVDLHGLWPQRPLQPEVPLLHPKGLDRRQRRGEIRPQESAKQRRNGIFRGHMAQMSERHRRVARQLICGSRQQMRRHALRPERGLRQPLEYFGGALHRRFPLSAACRSLDPGALKQQHSLVEPRYHFVCGEARHTVPPHVAPDALAVELCLRGRKPAPRE